MIYMFYLNKPEKKRFIIASIYRSFIQWDLEIEAKKNGSKCTFLFQLNQKSHKKPNQ